MCARWVQFHRQSWVRSCERQEPVSEECHVANRAPLHHRQPMGLPSPEALQMATDVIRRRYVLPETMERPEVRSECMRLAYLIMAYGLGSEYDHNRH